MAESRNSETWVVRTPPGMRDRLSAAARHQRLKGGRNELALRAFERTLALQEFDDALPEDDEVRTPCERGKHPSPSLRVFAHGTFCAACGARVQPVA